MSVVDILCYTSLLYIGKLDIFYTEMSITASVYFVCGIENIGLGAWEQNKLPKNIIIMVYTSFL